MNLVPQRRLFKIPNISMNILSIRLKFVLTSRRKEKEEGIETCYIRNE